MALSKQKKSDIVGELGELLASSKLTVIAHYRGTSVKAMQQLRRQARDNNSQVKVVKNRLVKMALAQSERFKDIETDILQGQLMYVFNSEDEVAPAQTLAAFAKDQPQIKFVGGLNADGQLLSSEDVAALAELPGKEQLKGMLVGTIAAPISGFVGVLTGNVRGVLNVLNARSIAIK